MTDIIKESVKYIFTDDEKKEIAADMARAVQKVDDLTAELKDIQIQYKANISAKNSEVKAKAALIRDGYEYRYCECHREIKNNKCYLYDVETGDLVKERDLTADERQIKINE